MTAGPRDMRLYYHSYDQRKQKFVVGLATSPDGFRWTKQGPVFEVGQDRCGFGAACGVRGRHADRWSY